MGRYYPDYKDCTFCGNEFETTRSDARFCSGKCRTANSRREKRRLNAEKEMHNQWDTHTQHAYSQLIHHYPAGANQIKDIYIQRGEKAAADATQLAHQIINDLTQRMEHRLNQQQNHIQRLQADAELLSHIRNLIT